MTTKPLFLLLLIGLSACHAKPSTPAIAETPPTDENDSLPVDPEPASADVTQEPSEDEARKSVAKIVLEDPVIKGPLNFEMVSNSARQELPALTTCFQDHTFVPDEDSIVIKVIISGGAVTKAAIKVSALNNIAVERCLTDQLGTWQFGAPTAQGVTVVEFPFRSKFE